MTDLDDLLDLLAAHLDALRAEAKRLERQHFPRLAARLKELAERLEERATQPTGGAA